MSKPDLERILELRETVRRAADPRAFGLLREMREARWAITEEASSDSAVVGMVGAVPLREVGVLCHLPVHHDHRKLGLGATLFSRSIYGLRSRGAKVVRLDATHGAQRLCECLVFKARLAAHRVPSGGGHPGGLAARCLRSRRADARAAGEAAPVRRFA